MRDDQFIDFMAQMGDYMRSTDQRFEQMNRNFERVITVMHDGFGRVTGQLQELNGRVDHLTERVDHLTERVDHLTEEVRELKDDVRVLKEDMREVKQDIRDIKAEAQITNRRLNATFDQAGYLTEQDTAIALRGSHFEQAQKATNEEVRQRLQGLENRLNKAS